MYHLYISDLNDWQMREIVPSAYRTVPEPSVNPQSTSIPCPAGDRTDNHLRYHSTSLVNGKRTLHNLVNIPCDCDISGILNVHPRVHLGCFCDRVVGQKEVETCRDEYDDERVQLG